MKFYFAPPTQEGNAKETKGKMSKTKDKHKEPKGDKKAKSEKKGKAVKVAAPGVAAALAPLATPKDEAAPIPKTLPSFVRVAAEKPAAGEAPAPAAD